MPTTCERVSRATIRILSSSISRVLLNDDLSAHEGFMNAYSGFVSLIGGFVKCLALLGVALGSVSAVRAASPAPTITPRSSRPPACVTAEFRQFDFWLGRWKVTNSRGDELGTSEILRVSEGCAIREQWKAASNSTGTSINYYDIADHEWHQDWVGGDGTILHLHGGLRNGAMVLSGDTESTKGRSIQRITWTPLPDGKVKQEWEVSVDSGSNWQTAFVGLYEKQP
jgi:hypothetical protein